MTRMPRALLALAAAVLLAAGAMVAQQAAVHRVIEGDTLWDLAGHYMQNSFSWPLIWEANKDKVEDPHWIYPGQELVIPPLAASGPAAEPDSAAPAVLAPAPEPEPEPEPEEPVAKPAATSQRSQLIGVRRSTEPVVSEALAFISGYLSTEEEKPLGRFIKTDVKEADYLTTNDRVYLNLGVREGTRPGDRFAVYRLGKGVKHPKGGQDLGKMVMIVGVVEVEQVEEQSCKARIIKSYQPLGKKETVKPYVEAVVPKNVKPLPVQKSNEGYIVALREPELAATTYKVAYIDKGLADGIVPGDVFEIYRVQKEASDPDRGGSVKLPELVVGAVQVLAVRNNTASAYISASRVEDVKVGETIRLVKKMPR